MEEPRNELEFFKAATTRYIRQMRAATAENRTRHAGSATSARYRKAMSLTKVIPSQLQWHYRRNHGDQYFIKCSRTRFS